MFVTLLTAKDAMIAELRRRAETADVQPAAAVRGGQPHGDEATPNYQRNAAAVSPGA